jgi:hypothetical protein
MYYIMQALCESKNPRDLPLRSHGKKVGKLLVGQARRLLRVQAASFREFLHRWTLWRIVRLLSHCFSLTAAFAFLCFVFFVFLSNTFGFGFKFGIDRGVALFGAGVIVLSGVFSACSILLLIVGVILDRLRGEP